MNTNNQNPNLPPAPDPPEEYNTKKINSAEVLPMSISSPPTAPLARQPEQQHPKLPPLPPVPNATDKIKEVNFIDPDLEKKQNKKIIIYSVVAVLLTLVVWGILAMTVFKKNVKNIKVSGNEVKFEFKGTDISGQLGIKGTQGFVTNGGQIETKDSGLFGVIPSEKVRQLEQRYKDIIHCGTVGAEEVKSNEISSYFLINTSSAKTGLESLDKLMKEGNWVEFEIEGQRIGQMRANQNGKDIPVMNQPNLIFYLVDDLRIVNEDYK